MDIVLAVSTKHDPKDSGLALWFHYDGASSKRFSGLSAFSRRFGPLEMLYDEDQRCRPSGNRYPLQ